MIHKCRGRGKVREDEETLYILVIGNCICNYYIAYMGVSVCVSIYVTTQGKALATSTL